MKLSFKSRLILREILLSLPILFQFYISSYNWVGTVVGLNSYKAKSL